MSQWRQIAACANAPAAGNDGINVMVEQIAQALGNCRPHARETFSQHVRTQKHQRANFFFAESISHAGCVASHEVALELRDFFVADMDVGELAESGRDAINHAVLADDGFNNSARSRHLFCSVRMEADRPPVESHLVDVFDGESLAVDQQRIHRINDTSNTKTERHKDTRKAATTRI